MPNRVEFLHSGIKGEINLCKCGKQPYINSMPHGEIWIDCDCGRESELYKNDNQPSLALKKAVKYWNRSNRRTKCLKS